MMGAQDPLLETVYAPSSGAPERGGWVGGGGEGGQFGTEK
jgi:hypothetical protein